ncbi:hypothetical protein Cgig2_004770 [Carnegiea gigantea]|uniref:Heat shock protein 70 n=1 Tax=Carnegiea gigantea TaxID=171969 RepID=A0A9Q1QPE5_9CARY|nr:hypothetical protein Cgig2_004770 [Carnegiea gigantea]
MERSDIHDVVLVGGSTRIPKIQQLIQDFFHGKELCKSINPDEAVAYGAAFHAATLTGVIGKAGNGHAVLMDVTPLSLGVVLYGGDMKVMVPRNTTIPTKMVGRMTTAYENQTVVRFSVYEGERPLVKDNNLLGTFSLYDVPLAPQGVPQFDVYFNIDPDGLLTVSAELLGMNNKKQITIANHSGRLSKEEIDRMVKEADIFKAEDEKRKKGSKAKNSLENYVNFIKGILRGGSKKIRIKDKRKLGDVIEQITQWLEWNYLLGEPTKFEEKMKKLESICEPIIAEVDQHHDAGGKVSHIRKKVEVIDNPGISINPDEAVACGAAFHAATLAGVGKISKRDVVLKDVTPLSLGIELLSGDMNFVVRGNTSIPTTMDSRIWTALDYQTATGFSVYEGERPLAKDNHFLGKFDLHDIPRAAKFDVYFKINVDGILAVSADLLGTNNKKQIIIDNHSGRLSKKEIDRMVKDGKMFNAEDEEHMKRSKANNKSENYVHFI